MSREQVEQALAGLPLYYGVRDLQEAFGSKDALLDAYCEGHLPPVAEQTLEQNYAQLQCWLLARLIRLTLEPETL